ncbi:het domain protein [Seiridium cupressi]
MRMSWASKRRTRREADMAYYLLGIFDDHMPLLYGEGGGKAFLRLQEEMIKSTRTTPFWPGHAMCMIPRDLTNPPAFLEPIGVLETSPTYFDESRDLISPWTTHIRAERRPFGMNNIGD